jgi:hypothetical protein
MAMANLGVQAAAWEGVGAAYPGAASGRHGCDRISFAEGQDELRQNSGRPLAMLRPGLARTSNFKSVWPTPK